MVHCVIPLCKIEVNCSPQFSEYAEFRLLVSFEEKECLSKEPDSVQTHIHVPLPLLLVTGSCTASLWPLVVQTGITQNHGLALVFTSVCRRFGFCSFWSTDVGNLGVALQHLPVNVWAGSAFQTSISDQLCLISHADLRSPPLPPPQPKQSSQRLWRKPSEANHVSACPGLESDLHLSSPSCMLGECTPPPEDRFSPSQETTGGLKMEGLWGEAFSWLMLVKLYCCVCRSSVFRFNK